MLVTPSGITMLPKEPQPINASLPMLVTLSGITISVKEEYPQNAISQIIFVPFLME